MADHAVIKIRHGAGTPTTANLDTYELGWDTTNHLLYINDGAIRLAGGLTGTVGSSTSPIYLNNGTLTTCGSSLAVSITGSAASCNGNAATATTLATARTLTIGSTGKSFNGSANVSWSLSEIGAAAASHTHSYLPLSGGDISGHIYMTGAQASSSTANTSQIVFGTSSSNHVAISSNTNNLIINPTTSSTTGQIQLKVGSSPAILINGTAVSLSGHTHSYAGSSSAGGSATSAVKLDTSSAGSSTQPVYFSSGKPTACTAYSSASVNYATSAGKATTDASGNTITSYYGRKPVTLYTSNSSKACTTTLASTGLYVTVPANSWLAITGQGYYSSVNCASVALASATSGNNSILAQSDVTMSGGGRCRTYFIGHTGTSAETYYLWAKGASSGNLGLSIDGFYIPM